MIANDRIMVRIPYHTIKKLDWAKLNVFLDENNCDSNFGISFGKGSLKSQQRPTGKVLVYKIQVNPIHTILKYGDYYDFMDR